MHCKWGRSTRGKDVYKIEHIFGDLSKGSRKHRLQELEESTFLNGSACELPGSYEWDMNAYLLHGLGPGGVLLIRLEIINKLGKVRGEDDSSGH